MTDERDFRDDDVDTELIRAPDTQGIRTMVKLMRDVMTEQRHMAKDQARAMAEVKEAINDIKLKMASRDDAFEKINKNDVALDEARTRVTTLEAKMVFVLWAMFTVGTAAIGGLVTAIFAVIAKSGP